MCIYIEPLPKKIEAFGAKVVTIDGHDITAIIEATKAEREGKPLVILGYTCPYQGLDILKERFPYLHFVRFKNDEERRRYQDFLHKIKNIEGVR